MVLLSILHHQRFIVNTRQSQSESKESRLTCQHHGQQTDAKVIETSSPISKKAPAVPEPFFLPLRNLDGVNTDGVGVAFAGLDAAGDDGAVATLHVLMLHSC